MKSDRQAPAPRDASAVHARLARLLEQSAGAPPQLSPEQQRALLEERARHLARVAAPEAAPGETVEVIAFAVGRERYGVELRHVREVVRLIECTPVPNAPEFLLGVMNLRGEILPLVDLRRFFDLPQQGLTDLSRVVVLGSATAPDLGVLADATPELRTLRLSELDGSETPDGVDRRYLRGVTADALIVLDGERLLAHRGTSAAASS